MCTAAPSPSWIWSRVSYHNSAQVKKPWRTEGLAVLYFCLISNLQISWFQRRPHVRGNRLGCLSPAERSRNSQPGHRASLHPCSGICCGASERPSGPSPSFPTIPWILDLTDSTGESSPAASPFPLEPQQRNKEQHSAPEEVLKDTHSHLCLQAHADTSRRPWPSPGFIQECSPSICLILYGCSKGRGSH